MPVLPVSERSRSRCIFSASDSAAPLPTFFESTSIRDCPVRVSSAHKSNRSFSSARGRTEVSKVPSGDSRSACGCGPARSGLAKTRSSVSGARSAAKTGIATIAAARTTAARHMKLSPLVGRLSADAGAR